MNLAGCQGVLSLSSVLLQQISFCWGLTCVQLCHLTFVEIERPWWFSLRVFELPEIRIGLFCAFGIFCLLSDVPMNWAVLLCTVSTLAECGGDAVLAALQTLKGAGGTGPVSIHVALSALRDLAGIKLGCCLCWEGLDQRMKLWPALGTAAGAVLKDLLRDFSAQK